MKILIPVKRGVDYNVRIRVKEDASGVETDGVKHSINPFDEIALEEAISLREKGIAESVTALTIGAQAAQEVLRHALAMGADSAVHMIHDAPLEPLLAAKLIRAYAANKNFSLILMGKQAIDNDYNQTGQMLAALLGWPQATFASKIEISEEEAAVTREIDGGLMTVKVRLPAVITVDLRLNEPRYATLPNIMKAKSKPIEQMEAASFGINLTPQLRIAKVETPAPRKGGIMVESVDTLLDKLKHEAKVLP